MGVCESLGEGQRRRVRCRNGDGSFSRPVSRWEISEGNWRKQHSYCGGDGCEAHDQEVIGNKLSVCVFAIGATGVLSQMQLSRAMYADTRSEQRVYWIDLVTAILLVDGSLLASTARVG